MRSERSLRLKLFNYIAAHSQAIASAICYLKGHVKHEVVMSTANGPQPSVVCLRCYKTLGTLEVNPVRNIFSLRATLYLIPPEHAPTKPGLYLVVTKHRVFECEYNNGVWNENADRLDVGSEIIYWAEMPTLLSQNRKGTKQ